MTEPASDHITPRKRKRGRPARSSEADGAPTARDRILISARGEFAERGYEKTSIRAIARGAEVDPALVHHYFGNKERVFDAAVKATLTPALQHIAHIGLDEPEHMGERMTRFFFGVWDNPVTRGPMLAVVRSAVTNETAARIFRGFMTKQVLGRLVNELEGPDRELRVQLAIAQLVGSALLRYVIKIEPLASAEVEDVIQRLSPVVQHHFSGSPRP